MSVYLQYHNAGQRGLAGLLSPTGRGEIVTRRPGARTAKGTVVLIVGVGRPRTYYLWQAFEIDRVKADATGNFFVSGPGWQLAPPQALAGRCFDNFKARCANFVGFRAIDDLPYHRDLLTLARQHRPRRGQGLSQEFLTHLLGQLKSDSTDHALVSQLLSPTPLRPPVSSLRSAVSTRNLRALSLRQPHAEAVLRGVKHIEYRNRPTKVRGPVQIYASRVRYAAREETKMMADYGLHKVACDDLPRGVLVGTVEICGCDARNGQFEWSLRNPQRATKLLKPKRRPQPVWFNPF